MQSSIKRSLGFTLIELMIAVVIVAILASIAIPSYSSYVRKSRRTEAKTALLDLASLEERYFSLNNVYTNLPTQVGYTGAASKAFNVGGNYYSVTISNVNAPSLTAPATFTLTANAIGSQVNDTLCTWLAVDQTGAQTSSDTTNNACWH